MKKQMRQPSPTLSRLLAALLAAVLACGLNAPIAYAGDDDAPDAIAEAQSEALNATDSTEEDAVLEDSDAVEEAEIEGAEVEADPELVAQASDIASGTWGTCQWKIDGEGTLWVYPGRTPDCGAHAYAPWLPDNREQIKKAVFVKNGNDMVVDRGITDNLGSLNLLQNCPNLKEVDLTGLDVAHMEHDSNLSGLFSNCPSLVSVDLSPLDTSKITDMTYMFDGCSSLTSVDMSMLDLSSLSGDSPSMAIPQGMYAMFRGCTSLKSVEFPSKIGKINSLGAMFKDCASLETLDLSIFDLSQTQSIGDMFSGCTSLKTVYVGDKWNLDYMTSLPMSGPDGRTATFNGCTSLEGGSGTTYDASHMGYQYACIDTPDTPGYLTRKGQPAFRDLNYAFSNSYEGFGYPRGYVIPLERYELLFGPMRAKLLFKAENEWGGSCYGMSSSSSMMNTDGSGILASGFNANALSPRDLGNRDANASIGLNLTAFIEVMQISSHADAYGEAFYDNYGVQRVLNYVRTQTAAGHPVTLGVFRTSIGYGGHAILAYGVEKASDGGWQILVYDNNWPEHGRAIHVDTNSSGGATGWSYTLWEGMTYTNSRIVYFPYDTYADAWNNRYANKTGGTTNVLSTNSRNFELFDANGNLVATVEEGLLQEGAGDGVWQHHAMHATEDNVDDEQPVILTLPNGLAHIENKDASVDKLEASVSDQEQMASVTTNADKVELVVDDTAANSVATVASGTGSYEITLESTLPQAKGKEVVEVSGSLSGAGASVGMARGTLDTSKAAGATVKINGKQQVEPKVTGIADGKTAVVGGATYKIKSNAKKTVYYHKAPKTKKSVTVPAKVTINGKAYTVAGISKNAFKGVKAKTVTVKTAKLTKKSVKGAFNGAKKVKTVKVKVGTKAANKKAIAKYKKYFTKKNCGAKVTVK